MKLHPRWISRKALLLLHEESLAEFGGAQGMANEGLLDSALSRPLNARADRPETTIAELAASYAYGLARNHAFVDGNKRAAFLSIGIFLTINGYKLVAGQIDAIQAIFAVAAGEPDERGLAAWIAKNSRPIPK
ncbi:MAG TPA: type II toxin-antitoxin system death-on-curing family toxin [Bryobacteraceae bacterium]|nr:type II toxin-antitoxin system death-on-curing family toxin [Bryobacteraceae bacterium]